VTGRPDVDLSRKPGTGKLAEYCPTRMAQDWPRLRSAQDADDLRPRQQQLCAARPPGVPATYTPAAAFVACQVSARPWRRAAAHFGEVQAWNVDTGQRCGRTTTSIAETGARCWPRAAAGIHGGTSDSPVPRLRPQQPASYSGSSEQLGHSSPPTSFAIGGKPVHRGGVGGTAPAECRRPSIACFRATIRGSQGGARLGASALQ